MALIWFDVVAPNGVVTMPPDPKAVSSTPPLRRARSSSSSRPTLDPCRRPRVDVEGGRRRTRLPIIEGRTGKDQSITVPPGRAHDRRGDAPGPRSDPFATCCADHADPLRPGHDQEWQHYIPCGLFTAHAAAPNARA